MKATTSEIYIMHDTVNIMDDRGDLDLTKQIDNLKETVYGFKLLVEIQKQEIWNLKEQVAEGEKNKNLLQGYKKVIQNLTARLNK